MALLVYEHEDSQAWLAGGYTGTMRRGSCKLAALTLAQDALDVVWSGRPAALVLWGLVKWGPRGVGARNSDRISRLVNMSFGKRTLPAVG